MTCLSFSGETKRGPFYTQILRREKTQTCRAPRSRPIKAGDNLALYWKQRLPKDKKPIHLIGYAKCMSVEQRPYLSFAYDDEFARRDGFTDSTELREWFGDPSIYGREVYDVISFRLHFSTPEYAIASGRGYGMSMQLEIKAQEWLEEPKGVSFSSDAKERNLKDLSGWEETALSNPLFRLYTNPEKTRKALIDLNSGEILVLWEMKYGKLGRPLYASGETVEVAKAFLRVRDGT